MESEYRIRDLAQQVAALLREKKELEEKLEELRRKWYVAELRVGYPLYWTEVEK